LATGIMAARDLQRTAHKRDHYPLGWEALFSLVRGAAFAAGLFRLVGLPFAVAFGVLNTLGQVAAYAGGFRPSVDYAADGRPRFTRRHMWGVVRRTVGHIAAAMICGTLVRRLDHPWAFALRVGLVTGVVTAAGTVVNPVIEFYADRLPERRLGVFGIALVLCGFALQSLQYWLVILDVRVS
jgi:hypothetical protein